MPSGALAGRIAVITGAGRGIGRHHALLFAAEGARVVVNDLGCAADGTGTDGSVASEVVAEITAAGGEAVASAHDVATMGGAAAVLQKALDSYGEVDVLVNNAGILRDAMFVNMSEDDWDAVVRGHLRTTFCMTQVCAARWREQSKAGAEVNASVVNISSTSGLIGAVGQSNYGAAKAAIAAMTVILAQELGRYGVRVNCVTPAGRTRMTEGAPGTAELVAEPAEGFDVFHPAHPAPVVGWLATADCDVTGRVFMAKGGDVRWYTPWLRQDFLDEQREWSIAELAEAMADLPPLPASP